MKYFQTELQDFHMYPPLMFVHVTNNFINYAFYSVFYLKRPKLKKILFHVNVYEGVHMEVFPKQVQEISFLCTLRSERQFFIFKKVHC